MFSYLRVLLWINFNIASRVKLYFYYKKKKKKQILIMIIIILLNLTKEEEEFILKYYIFGIFLFSINKLKVYVLF